MTINQCCKNCAWHEIVCDSCHGSSGLRGWINFTKEELEDLISNLEQCESEGYLDYGDPAYEAMNKISLELEKIGES